MSSKPDEESNTAEDVVAHLDRAHAIVGELCSGNRRWTMSVPGRIDSDPDLVIGVALRRARSFILAKDAELSTFREKAGDVEKLETAILATKFSDDESWAAAVARVMSAHLLEGKTMISPVQRRAGDVEVIAKVLHEAEFQSDYETVSESGKEECRRIARILSYHLLEGKP